MFWQPEITGRKTSFKDLSVHCCCKDYWANVPVGAFLCLYTSLAPSRWCGSHHRCQLRGWAHPEGPASAWSCWCCPRWSLCSEFLQSQRGTMSVFCEDNGELCGSSVIPKERGSLEIITINRGRKALRKCISNLEVRKRTRAHILPHSQESMRSHLPTSSEGRPGKGALQDFPVTTQQGTDSTKWEHRCRGWIHWNGYTEGRYTEDEDGYIEENYDLSLAKRQLHSVQEKRQCSVEVWVLPSDSVPGGSSSSPWQCLSRSWKAYISCARKQAPSLELNT